MIVVHIDVMDQFSNACDVLGLTIRESENESESESNELSSISRTVFQNP